MAADRHDPLLAALPDHANKAVLEVDSGLLEPHGLGDAEAGAVEQLDERLVAECARLRARGRVDQPLRLAGGERPRQRPLAPRQRDAGGRVVVSRPEQLLVAEEAARRSRPTGDRRAREAVRAELRRVELELL